VPVLRVGRVAQLAGTVALFKVASGLSERWITFDERAYAGHFDDMASMAEVVDLDDAARTHPLVPLRVKALLGFSQSTKFAGAFGRKARISARELETSVATMLSVLDPDLSELEGAKEEDAFGRFLMDGALLVIGADGVVEPGEVAWLQSVTKAEWSAEQIAQQLGDADAGAWRSRYNPFLQRSGLRWPGCGIEHVTPGRDDPSTHPHPQPIHTSHENLAPHPARRHRPRQPYRSLRRMGCRR
jgi:hypothetical protein